MSEQTSTPKSRWFFAASKDWGESTTKPEQEAIRAEVAGKLSAFGGGEAVEMDLAGEVFQQAGVSFKEWPDYVAREVRGKPYYDGLVIPFDTREGPSPVVGRATFDLVKRFVESLRGVAAFDLHQGKLYRVLAVAKLNDGKSWKMYAHVSVEPVE